VSPPSLRGASPASVRSTGKELFAPVYRAMREALGKGDWDEFHRVVRIPAIVSAEIGAS